MSRKTRDLGALGNRDAANDNGEISAADGERSPWSRLAKPSSYPRVITDMPERFPVIHAEVDLIEAYLSDLISAIIANDNEA